MRFDTVFRLLALLVAFCYVSADFGDSYAEEMDYYSNFVKKGGPQGPLRFGKRRGPSGPLRFGKRSMWIDN